MKRFAQAVLLTLALSSSGCTTLLGAFFSAAGHAATQGSDTLPPPPQPEQATVTDSLNARRPEVIARLVGEVSIGSTTKQCVYSYAGKTHIKTVSIAELCPPTIKVLPW